MTDWYQQSLTAPEIIELRARFGVVVDGDHVQWQVELIDPATSIQVAMASEPHAEFHEMWPAFERLVSKARSLLELHVDPF